MQIMEFCKQPIGRRQFQVILQRSFKKYGFETKLTMMDVRRYIFTTWLESKVPLQRLKALSGHLSDVLDSVYNKPSIETTLNQHRMISKA